MNPENLFNPDIGIYVIGINYIESKLPKKGQYGPMKEAFCNYEMRGKEWEREAFITIFDKGKINLQQKIGLRIKGAFTRNNPGKTQDTI